MASSGRKSSGKKRNASGGSRNQNTGRQSKKQAEQDQELFSEIGRIVFGITMLLLFFCNFGIIGPFGNAIRGILFGLFGLPAYITPICLFLAVMFWMANPWNPVAVRKLLAATGLYLSAGVLCEMVSGTASTLDVYDVKAIYDTSSNGLKGGGVLAGSITYLLHHNLETVGTILVILLCSVICLILLTEKSFIEALQNGAERIRDMSAYEDDEDEPEDEEEEAEDVSARRKERELRRQEANRRRREEAERRRELARQKREEQEEIRARREEERRLREEEIENEKILRMEKKVTGVTADTSLKSDQAPQHKEEIHEISYNGDSFEFERIQVRSRHAFEITGTEEEKAEENEREDVPVSEGSLEADAIRVHKDGQDDVPCEGELIQKPTAVRPETKAAQPKPQPRKVQKYIFPPLSRLQKGKGSAGDSARELKETAMRLQKTLETFGVKVTVTDISQGPSVTRYELQPEVGVKVSKIVGLTDDIKLNLAATDIRIEAPIPGKAAVGIEVPNRETSAVALRDLLESREFTEFESNIAFAVGKDIAGKVVVADIAKMPHMLIAGATGSGKSVCINTLIMSILYKAHPDDVKLIMVDPKVVELSVYNGIPHLLIPVVTDPKKASAALHWAVSEMEERYRRFAEENVRDLKGYNQKVEQEQKLPQIVIIVDELADLMMVSPGEVEECICRLAQLARACGIHLIIATQRPSVDVITGLIKANMPSRVAFAVSSGTDSRTILDMVGAEKLLGKGDMLFYPQGYSKPARVQGAFVSDREVSDVVDFLKNQSIGNVYAEDIEDKIRSIGSGAGGASGGSAGASGGDGRDEYFAEAGRFIIDKDKASIGMLQRLLKVGFNRAARIMDQLCEYGVVGEEEGTKPRKVLMTMEQFEQLLEEI